MALITKIKEYREKAGYKQMNSLRWLEQGEKRLFILKMADIILP